MNETIEIKTESEIVIHVKKDDKGIELIMEYNIDKILVLQILEQCERELIKKIENEFNKSHKGMRMEIHGTQDIHTGEILKKYK